MRNGINSWCIFFFFNCKIVVVFLTLVYWRGGYRLPTNVQRISNCGIIISGHFREFVKTLSGVGRRGKKIQGKGWNNLLDYWFELRSPGTPCFTSNGSPKYLINVFIKSSFIQLITLLQIIHVTVKYFAMPF